MFRFLSMLFTGHVRRHRLEAILCLLGVVLGVAVVVSIEAAVAACVQSFTGAVGSFAERSTHSIFAQTGGVPDTAYIALLKKRLSYSLAPVIDRHVLVTDRYGQEHLARLIGIDVFSERSLRSFTKMQSSLDESAFDKFMTEPGAVVAVKRLADDDGLSVGGSTVLVVGGQRQTVHVVGIVTPAGVAAAQLTDVLICDLATAQELTGSLDSIDRVDTLLDDDASAEKLAVALPPGLVLRSTSQQAGAFGQLIQSYKLNLNALSLMAAFVAVFVVYNSMLISVRQRLATLGILRCLGASKKQLGGLYLAEAAVYATIGGVLGVLAGWGLSQILVGYVGTTINDLYAAVKPVPVKLDRWLWAEGMAVAVASCLLGAVVPLVQASRTPPINAFRGSDRLRSSGRVSLALLLVGVLMLGGAWIAYVVPGESPVAGFVMALLVASGFAVVCPWVLRTGLRTCCRRVARPAQWLPLQMASAERRTNAGHHRRGRGGNDDGDGDEHRHPHDGAVVPHVAGLVDGPPVRRRHFRRAGIAGESQNRRGARPGRGAVGAALSRRSISSRRCATSKCRSAPSRCSNGGHRCRTAAPHAAGEDVGRRAGRSIPRGMF